MGKRAVTVAVVGSETRWRAYSPRSRWGLPDEDSMSPPVNHSGTVSPATRIPRACAWGFLPGSMSTPVNRTGVLSLLPASATGTWETPNL